MINFVKIIYTAVICAVISVNLTAADVKKTAEVQPLRIGMEMGKPENTDVKVVTSPVTAAFIKAADTGAMEGVKKGLSEGADINGKTDDKFQVTALMKSCESNHGDITLYLVDKGADVNVISRFGFTALMYAAKAGNKRSVRALIRAGADPNIVGHMFSTALGWAADDETRKLLIKAGAKEAW